MLLITHALDEANLLSDRIGVMSARPGCFIDIVETGWPHDRDSRLAERADFGAVTSRLWSLLRSESMRAMGQGAARQVSKAAWIRIAILVGAIGLLEVSCRIGWVRPTMVIAPSHMVSAMVRAARLGRVGRRHRPDLPSVGIAIVLSIVGGFTIGFWLHWFPPLRRAVDPFLAAYYAIPHFAFYPLLIVIFGLGSLPLIVLATLFAMVAMIVATLAGLDRVPRVLLKTARVHRLSPL